MSVLRLHIVGIPHREDLKGHVDEFLSEAVGHTLALWPHCENDNDKNAIRAYDWLTRWVGYVAGPDLPYAWEALQCSDENSIRGTIVSADREHPCLMFESDVPGYDGCAADIYPQQPFLDWTYSGPVLRKPDELSHLLYIMDEIKVRLKSRADWSKEEFNEFRYIVERFTQLSIYDISSDMLSYRIGLVSAIRDAKLEGMDGAIRELERTPGRTGRKTTKGEVYDYWMKIITSAENQSRMMARHSNYNTATIENELKQFPKSMYDDWLENRALFISRMYYQRIPREAIWKFVSGISFLEQMKSRVDEDTKIIASEVVDTALPMDVASMKVVEMLLSRINDKHAHVFDAELERLRKSKDAKVATETAPRKIGQLIAKQQNLGNASGMEALLESDMITKLLDKL